MNKNESPPSWLPLTYPKTIGKRLQRHIGMSDLLQEASLEYLKRRGRGILHPTAYVWSLVTRLAGRRALRERGEDVGTDVPQLSTDSTPSHHAQQSEEHLLAQQALERLPSQQAEIVRLRILEDMPFKDCAVQMGCGEAHARVTFHRALVNLRERLDGPR